MIHLSLILAKWEKPARGRYKCNIDASFSSQLSRVGIDMCIRDDEGRFVLAKTIWKSPICNVDLGEALGLLHAIRWVQELQLGNVDFAMDSKTAVDQFHNKGIAL
ncbi:cytochrome p450, partial [Trifolium pratense]